MTATTTERTSHASALYYRFEGKFTDIKPIGVVPDGVRMDSYFAGRITDGELAGAELTGVDYFRVRSDGVGVVDGRELLVVDGQHVSVTLSGYSLPPAGAPVPTAQQLTDPTFAWPDAPLAIEVFATFETGAPALEHLNRTIVAHTGWVNMATRELYVEARRLG
jgi:hypothetical protein